MIIKLIDTKEGAKAAGRYARELAEYMADADPRRLRADAIGDDYGLTLAAYMLHEPQRPDQSRERVLYKAALAGGEVANWELGVAEMERRMAARSRRIKKPARHVVMSYRTGETPTEQDCGDAVATLAQELGCERAVVLWAAHADTDNVHIHAMFVTVDPATGEALPFGHGLNGRAGYKEAMQRAIARIEHEQELRPEVGARYQIENGHVVRKAGRPTTQAKRAPLQQEVLAFEDRSGFSSFTRAAQEIAGPILDTATSWGQLHCDLARHGFGVRRAGNGGELHADGNHVKLSNVDRRHSWSKLIKDDRLGPYAEPNGITIAPFQPHVLDSAKAARWLRHQDVQRGIGERIDQRVASLMSARDASLADVRARIAAYQADLGTIGLDARLQGDIGRAWPRLQAQAAATINAAFAARIGAVRGLRHAAAGSADCAAVDLEAIGVSDAGFIAPWHDDRARPAIMSIPGLRGELCGRVVRYWVKDDHRRSASPALVDAGAIIWVNDRSDRAVAAALILAKERFGTVSAFGDPDYLARCARQAARLGIELEVISAAEAKQRARKVASARAQARQRALASKQSADKARLERVSARAAPDEGVAQKLSEVRATREVGDGRANRPAPSSADEVVVKETKREDSRHPPIVRRPIAPPSRDVGGIG